MEKVFLCMQRHRVAISYACLSAAGLGLYSPFVPLSPQGVLWRGLLGFILGLMLGLLPEFAHFPQSSRRFCYAFFPALGLAASCALGAELQVHGTLRTSFPALLINLFCFVGFTSLFTGAFLAILSFGGRWLRRWQTSRLEERLSVHLPFAQNHNTHLFFVFSFLALFLCWLPVWLAYFPGLANYDILSHMAQCVSGQYSTLHPMCYTLLLKLCLFLGNLWGGGTTLAIALLCIGQMVFMAGSIAYALSVVRKMGASLLSCLMGLSFFALFPVFPLLSISTTKDIPYAAFALLFGTHLARLCHKPSAFLRSPRACTPLVLSGIGMGILRYNGIISLLLWSLLFLCFARFPKQECRAPKLRIFCLLLLTAALTTGVNQGINSLTNAAPSFVTARDAASLPAQQMVRATLSMETDSDAFSDVMHWFSGGAVQEKHRPRLADYTKRYIDVGHSNGWRGFAETWLRVGLQYPKAYLESFLELNRGLWFVHDLSHANIYPEELPLFGYLLNNQADCGEYGEPVRFDSKLPRLQAFLNRLTTENTYLKIPGLRMIFSIGAQCWLCVLLFFAACYRRDRSLVCLMGWALCQLLILCAAPAVLVRYTLPIFLSNVIGLILLMRNPDATASIPDSTQKDVPL